MNYRFLLLVLMCFTQSLFGQYSFNTESGQVWEEIPLTNDRFSKIISTPLGYHSLTSDGEFYRHFEVLKDWQLRVGSIGDIEDKGLTYSFRTVLMNFSTTSQGVEHKLEFYNENGSKVKTIELPNDNIYGGNYPPTSNYRGNGLWTFYYDFNNERRMLLKTKDHSSDLIEQTFMDNVFVLSLIHI